MSRNTQVLIAAVPDGPLAAEHFQIKETAAPVCGEGQVLCRTLALTIGAGQRAGLQGSASYAGAPKAGVVMGGTGVARVEESRAAGFAPGDVVVGPSGWQVLSVHKASALRKVPPGADPALHLGVLGTNGLTAYFGLLDVVLPSPEQPSSFRPLQARSVTSLGRSRNEPAVAWSASPAPTRSAASSSMNSASMLR